MIQGASVHESGKLKLLIPLDGSQLAESVIPIVELLGSKYSLDVFLFHVIESTPPSTVHGDKHLTSFSEAETYLDKLKLKISHVTQNVFLHVHQSAVEDVAASIIEHSDEFQADWIVLCTHGKSGAKNVLFGSIAQQTLHGGTRPVLLIPPAIAKPGSRPLIRKIMIPCDAEHAHNLALNIASNIAKNFEAEVHLLSVIPKQEDVRGELGITQRFLPNAMKALLDLAETDLKEELEKGVAELAKESIVACSAIRRGDILKNLVRYARDTGVDFLVVTSHGRHGLSAFFEGSLLPRLINQTATPMLLVREPD